jgi:outer membrane lipoprotein-sorting protein
MRSESTCASIREDLSAYIDNELAPSRRVMVEEHLATCTACRREEGLLRSVRKMVRVQVVENIPDLTTPILARIEATRPARNPWHERFQVAAISAAAAALVILGASLPFDTNDSDIARASEITAQARAAARRLDAYEATFAITERGWHPDVPTRHLTAEVDFVAPENFRLEVRDDTEYPTGEWPRNDVSLISTSSRWWIEEPSSCPAEALPNCAAPTTWAGVTERRVVTHRQPFDGTSALPTDIIVPLETLAGEGFEVLGDTEIDGRPAYRLQLAYRQAVPLIASLEAGGSWREFHPLDKVDLWIDRQTWFPLRFEVVAGSSPDRALWATRRGLSDEPGSTLLSVVSTGFSEPSGTAADSFDVPTSGIARDGGFETARATDVPVPSFLAGLVRYRSGRTLEGGSVIAFTDGMEYLKVVERAGTLSQDAIRSAEELDIGTAGYAYYLPASQEIGRRLEIATGERIIQLQTNLPRDAFLEVARSMDVMGERAPRVIEKSHGLVLRRIDPKRTPPGFARVPSYLPDGYEPAAGSMATTASATRTYTVYYRRAEGEFDGLGVRIVQSSHVEFLPPSSEDFLEIDLGETTARWSTERSELEWIDSGTYRAISVPSADLFTAVRIAEGLQ